jgi:ParB family chromosome partitioning protein
VSPRDKGPRLGRGLAALLGEAAKETEEIGVRTLPVEALEPGPYQPRRDASETLDELIASVRSQGILQPLLARPHPTRPGRYQIIAGERRWRAAQAAGLHEIPVLVRSLADAAALAAGLVENLQREDLNPIEEAEGYRRLLDEFAMTQETLGEAVGKSRSHVANMLRLLNLPAAVQAELRTGRLSAGHARALLAHPDPERAALTVISKGLSVRQTEALANTATAQRLQPNSEARRAASKDPDLAALERSLAERLGLKVEITARGQGGMVRFHYTSLDQLDGLIALLMRD